MKIIVTDEVTGEGQPLFALPAIGKYKLFGKSKIIACHTTKYIYMCAYHFFKTPQYCFSIGGCMTACNKKARI